MKIRMRFTALLALLAQSILSGPIAAETFWAVSGGKLVALTIDLQSFDSEPVLQATGLASLEILAAATEPATGDLWTVYRDIAAGQNYLGVWPTGAARPNAQTPTAAWVADLEF